MPVVDPACWPNAEYNPGSNAGSNRAAQSCTPTHSKPRLKHVGAPPETLAQPKLESRNA
jgi:hypothetical protein